MKIGATTCLIPVLLSAFLCSCQPVRPKLGYWAHPKSIGYEDLTAWLPIMAEKDVSIYIAVDQDQIEARDPQIADLIRSAAHHGVELRPWILLDYQDGYYPNEENVDLFSDTVKDLIRWVGEASLPLGWITVDMEPSVQFLNELNEYLREGQYFLALGLLLAQLNRPAYEQALEKFDDLVKHCHDHGFKVHVVTFPSVLDDLEDGDASLQDALNCPIHPLLSETWDDVDFMVYRTEMTGITGFPFGTDLVYTYAKDAVEVFGERSVLSLGIVGQDGAYDNYNLPEEILPDLGAAVSAGLNRVNVFSFTGADSLPDPEAWFDVEVRPGPPPVPDLFTRGMRLMYRLLDDLLL